jgi:hypothetical protein
MFGIVCRCLPILHIFFVGIGCLLLSSGSFLLKALSSRPGLSSLLGCQLNRPPLLPLSINDHDHDEQHLVQPTQLKTMLQLLHH